MVGYNDTHQLPHDTRRLTFGFTFKAAHAEEVQRFSYILIVLLALVVISEVLSTLVGWLYPDTRKPFVVSFSIIAAWSIFTVALYLSGLVGVLKRHRWGLIIAGVTSVLDATAGLFVFVPGVYSAVSFFLLAILVFAYLEYRQLSRG